MNTLTVEKNDIKINEVPKEAQAFYYPAGERAIFFVHGFSDSLCRVNGFAKFLSKRGITTKGVLLPGHGTNWEDLAKTTPKDWYNEVEKGILELSKNVKEIYIVAISFGGNLALKFDAIHPGIIKGLVCIETPMKIKYQPITKRAIPYAKKIGMEYWNKQYLKVLKHPEKEIVFKQGVLDKMPLDNIAQVIEFIEKQKSFLKKVTCDVLVIQSEKSNLIRPESPQIIIDSVSSKRKQIFKIDNVYHAFLSEPAKRTIFYEACKFFKIDY